MARIFVTGGAGYIGSILVPRLLTQGHQVTVLDSFAYGQQTLVDCCADPNFVVIRGDCRDERALRQGIKGADFILPLAAIVGAPACDLDPLAASTINFDAIGTLLRLRSPAQAVIFPCTNSGYGVGDKDSVCTEDSPLRPISHYGRTKVEAETAVLASGRAISLRLATVFGMSPRMRLDLLVNDFVYRAVTDGFVVVFEGHFKRNYLHVRDVASAFSFAMENFERLQDRPYNVGLSDANLSKLELCAAIKGHLPRFTYLEAPIGTDPDQRDYVISNERIERAGFRTEHSLDSGLQELIKGFSIVRRNQFSNVR
jgi:nucleoside-diphosphate-sugar epimerase